MKKQMSRIGSRVRRAQRSLNGLELLEDRLALSATVGDGLPEISFAVDTEWNSGYTGSITIHNDEVEQIEDWTLDFDMDSEISSIWNATITNAEGNHYTVENAGWNGQIDPGASISFGFVAAGAVGDGAFNFTFNGECPQPPELTLSIDNTTVVETDDVNLTAQISVQLSRPSTDLVTVGYQTKDDTAFAGVDFTAVAGTLEFAPGQTVQTISVPILDDSVEESNETLIVELTSATGAIVANSQGILTIEDNDHAVASAVEFSVVSDWGTGFTGQITINNESSTAWDDWTLEFDFAGNIPEGSIWNVASDSIRL